MLTKRSFCFYNLSIFFLIVSETFSDFCLNNFNRFVETAFHVFRRNFETLSEKFLIVSSSKDLERKSQIFFKFGRTISAGLSKGLLKSRELFRGKFIVFEEPILLFSFFELRAEIYRILEKIYRVVVKTGWNTFSGSFGGKNFSEKALISNQFRTLSDFSSNYS